MDDEHKQCQRLVEHLEAAVHIARGLGDVAAAYLSELALDEARAAMKQRIEKI